MSCRSWLATWTVDGAILVAGKDAAEAEEYCWEEHDVVLLASSPTSRQSRGTWRNGSGGDWTSGQNKDGRKKCLHRSHYGPQAK